MISLTYIDFSLYIIVGNYWDGLDKCHSGCINIVGWINRISMNGFSLTGLDEAIFVPSILDTQSVILRKGISDLIYVKGLNIYWNW